MTGYLQVADRVRADVMKQMPEVTDMIIHVAPGSVFAANPLVRLVV